MKPRCLGPADAWDVDDDAEAWNTSAALAGRFLWAQTDLATRRRFGHQLLALACWCRERNLPPLRLTPACSRPSSATSRLEMTSLATHRAVRGRD